MAQIPVVIIVDAESVVEQLGTNTDPATPAGPATPYVFMVVKHEDALKGLGQAELEIQVETEDEINWRGTSISMGARSSVLLYKFTNATHQEGGTHYIGEPEPQVAQVHSALPNMDDPKTPGRQVIEDYYWSVNALNPTDELPDKHVVYHFNFMILDHRGNVQGYYWFDPYIAITLAP